MSALLTHDEAAERIGVCSKTLRQLRKQGLIRYVALTRRKVLYRIEDCDAFLESRVTIDVPTQPTHRRRNNRLRTQGNVVSFMDRRRERQAAGGR